MATSNSTPSSSAPSAKPSPSGAAADIHTPANSKDAAPAANGLEQAIAMLQADHDEVRALFRAFKKLMDYDADDAAREDLAQRICNALTLHAELEEKLFYPAAREALPEDAEECVDHAEVEHGAIKELVAKIEASSADDPLYDSRVHVLAEYVAHHVKEEEEEMFAELRHEEADLDDVAAAMQRHRADWDAFVRADTPNGAGKRARASARKPAASAPAPAARKRASRGAARKAVTSGTSTKAAPRAKNSATAKPSNATR